MPVFETMESDMLSYDMAARREDPLYIHLSKCIKRDIESGAIEPHEKLPSKRSLARNLAVGVVTVEAAYAQLIAEGYLYAENRRGYFACDIEASPDASTCDSQTTRETPDIRPRAGRPAARGAYAASPQRENEPYRAGAWRGRPDEATDRRPVRFDLSFEASAARSFPLSVWSKAARDALSSASELSCLHDPLGSERLRRAIAAYLRRSRGLHADPDAIVVGATSQQLCALVAQLLGRPPRTVALENPGDARLGRIYEAHGFDISHVGLDDKGIDIAGLRASGASLVHTSPSHQFPTGIAMPVARRNELLAWAREQADRYIVEDDRDCTLRLAGKPLPTLQGADEHERVIHIGTFDATLAPALRIAYMVLPLHLAHAYRETLGFYPCAVSAIDQIALARFMEQKELERLDNRTKTRCRNTRDALMDALGKTPAATRIFYEHIDAGTYFILRVDAKNPPPSPARTPIGRTDGRAVSGKSAYRPPQRASDTPPAENEMRHGCAFAATQAALEERIASSLARQDVAVEPLSRYRSESSGQKRTLRHAFDPQENMQEAENGRIACRFALNCIALSEKQARAAAEAIYRGLAAFV